MKQLQSENGTKMKVVLLTSDHWRHKYIASALSEKLELALIISESKSPTIQDTSNLTPEEADFIQQHFKKREKSEQSFFGNFQEFPQNIPVLRIASGKVNTKKTIEAVSSASPDYILLFGSSIIGKELINKYQDKIINLHLGLSPYYKGSATNLFPYYFKEPECVGATIHLATSKVDEGAVLHQLRPEITVDDDLHAIGNKTILKAGKILAKIVSRYSERRIQPKNQPPAGKICRNKDLNPLVLRQIYTNFEDGMIAEYLKDKPQRDTKKPIIMSF